MKQNLLRNWCVVASCIINVSCGQGTVVNEKHPVDTTAVIKPSAADTGEIQDVIIPGSRLGHITLGLNADSVETILGAPDSSDAAMGKAWLIWRGKEKDAPSQLQIYTAYKDSNMAQKTVQQIRTTSAYFKTSTGLHVGSELATIKEMFPELKKTAVYTERSAQVELYDAVADGIAFEINGSVCESIILHKKGQRADAIYIMLHADMKRL